MLRRLSQVTALAILFTAGLVHSRWSGHLTSPQELRSQAAALDRIPLVLGNWHGQSQTLDERMIQVAGISHYLMRQYQNERTGDKLTVLLVCGPPGPISVHTPEVCYTGIGYQQASPLTRQRVDAETPARGDEFWVAKMAKPDALVPESLRILYGWSVGGPWTASDHPRLDFGGAPALYKLYVVSEDGGAESASSSESHPDEAFLRQFLPELRKALPTGPRT
ncbi:MAG: exosortase-associated EpsI family protein [Isosphaeraceae bacterium]